MRAKDQSDNDSAPFCCLSPFVISLIFFASTCRSHTAEDRSGAHCSIVRSAEMHTNLLLILPFLSYFPRLAPLRNILNAVSDDTASIVHMLGDTAILMSGASRRGGSQREFDFAFCAKKEMDRTDDAVIHWWKSAETPTYLYY